MKSRKTTLCGALAALGAYLASVTDPPWLATLGHGLTIAAPALLGLFARDNDKRSEDVGAGK